MSEKEDNSDSLNISVKQNENKPDDPFKGYFGDVNKRKVGSTQSSNSTLALGSYGDEISNNGVAPGAESVEGLAPRSVSSVNLKVSTLELKIDDETTDVVSKSLEVSIEDQNHTEKDSIEEISPVEVTYEEKKRSLGVEARALSSGAYPTGPVVAFRNKESFWTRLSANYTVMVILGAFLGLILGFGVATYYNSTILNKTIEPLQSKKEVAEKGAILLNDHNKIEKLEKQIKSERTKIAIKTAGVWFVFFGVFMGLWYKFAINTD